MSFMGIKNAGTILGSHEWQSDKLENFAITFWKKPTFTPYINKKLSWQIFFFEFVDWKKFQIVVATTLLGIHVPYPNFMFQDLYLWLRRSKIHYAIMQYVMALTNRSPWDSFSFLRSSLTSSDLVFTFGLSQKAL